MCYDPKDRPPDPPGEAGAASGREIELAAEDGTRFMAFVAEPASPGRAQLVIFPDVRGLHDFYKALALRFAEAGVRALAIDYFGRTAGTASRDDTFEYRQHVAQMQLPTFFQDARAALSYLRADGSGAAASFVLGFCAGGTLSLLAGTQDFDFAGVIAFYPGVSRIWPGSKGSTLELARESRRPVLALFGGADQGIPPEQVEQLDRELNQAGVEHEIVVYAGAPHSFFDRKAVEFAEASADAWRRVLAFIQAHSR